MSDLTCNGKRETDDNSGGDVMPEKIYRCPMCGYTHKDALIHMDHAICVRKGGPEMPEITDEELERLSCEIMAEQYK